MIKLVFCTYGQIVNFYLFPCFYVQKEEEISTQVHLLHKYIGEHIDGQKTVISQKLAVSGLLTTAPILKVPFKDEKISGDVFNLA